MPRKNFASIYSVLGTVHFLSWHWRSLNSEGNNGLRVVFPKSRTVGRVFESRVRHWEMEVALLSGLICSMDGEIRGLVRHCG